ncbi:LLM class flavin-dependent oxidoreductase [Nitrospirillum bahiense]|uniref:Luciferase-like monooxygenase n=1 Tax=Nitrospirillum amazonense TaxID=28077 RepID=A0A560G313_9PROT|nr:LLM class flavin-dependent oxidoreductase [Nitrospirillum amazonense]TWB28283.1 luciferase-like monooxygenase [Nitrospirillum amazonense]
MLRTLTGIRCGELWPQQAARQLATLDRMLGGRLAVNIISSDLRGETPASGPRCRRATEVMTVLRALLNGQTIDHSGEFYTLTHATKRGHSARSRSSASPFSTQLKTAQLSAANCRRGTSGAISA